MAIFPPDEPNYTDPVFDNFMNYGNGTFLIFITLASLFLNAIVFHVNLTQQQPGTSTTLFLVLAASDFLYSFIKPPYITYNLINPNVAPRVRNTEPSVIQDLVAGVTTVAAYTSICGIYGISIMRFIKLGYPLWAVSHRTIVRVIALVPMGITVFYSVGVEIAIVCGSLPTYIWTNTAQDVVLGYLNYFLLVKMWTVFIPAVLSLLLALATILKLSCVDQSDSSTRYSMVTIILLAISNVAWIVQWSVTAAMGADFFYNTTTSSVKCASFFIFFLYVMMPSIVALYNPMILCLRTTKMRNAISNIAKGRRRGDYHRIN